MENINIIILITAAAFYLSYFAKTLLLRRNGIVANRMGKGEKAAGAMMTERILSVATAIMAIVQILSIFGIITLLNAQLSVQYAGIAISALGVAFFVSALFAMKDSWRAEIDAEAKTELRTTGIMKISRNPAFLGFDLFYTGVALALPNCIIIFLTVICIVLFHFQILEEEKFLAAKFSDSYAGYKSRVHRYL